MQWNNTTAMTSRSFQCGYCGHLVATGVGYSTREYDSSTGIYICSHCTKPTWFAANGSRTPDVAPGNDIEHLPPDIQKLYMEARACVAAGAYTSSVLTCRKLLAHIGVAQGAEEGKPFAHYVDHLASAGYVPPNGKGWVDHIRKKGNEANHEIVDMSRQDATDLIVFLEMLLKFIYEFPNNPAIKPLPTPAA